MIKKWILKLSAGLRAIAYWKKSKRFKQEFEQLTALSQHTKQRFAMTWEQRYPCLDDNTATTGFDRHYVFHPAWAARIVAKNKPAVHVDISSTLYFCSMVSAFIPVQFYDYRPAQLGLSQLEDGEIDLTQLRFADNSVQSLSCMHTIEHIGLGRYGDPLDYDGDLKAIQELKRVLAPGGTLLFVTPVGQPKIMFNAHRIYSYEQILSYFEGLELKEFALIPDDEQLGGLMIDADPALVVQQQYACGCFYFSKPL